MPSIPFVMKIELLIQFLFLVVCILKSKKSSVDKYIIAYLSISFIGQLVSIADSIRLITSNVVEFAILQIIQVFIIEYLVGRSLSKTKVIPYGGFSVLFFFLFLWFSPYSSESILGSQMIPTVREHFNYHQYGDFIIVLTFTSIILVFYWLYKKVSSMQIDKDPPVKVYLTILGFLIYFAGGLMTIMFSRLLLSDYILYRDFKDLVYVPIYLFSYLLLTIAVRWKSV